MLDQESKQNVFMECDSKEAGFTMLSTLITFIIIVITLPFLAYFIQVMTPANYNEEIAVKQFFLFVRNDAALAEYFYASNNKIYFKVNEHDMAKLQQYDKLIRRQVNDQGHEVYTRNITKLQTESLTDGIRVIVTTLSGERYEKIFLYYD